MATRRETTARFLKRKKVWVPLLSLLLLGGGHYTRQFYQKRKLEKVQLDLSTLAKVERGDLEKKFKEVGSLIPKDNVDVVSQVSGRVTKLFVHQSQKVTKGEPLAVVLPGRTGAEKFLSSTIVAPADGVLLRCIQNGERGDSVKKFVELNSFITGRFDNAENFTCLMTIADMNKIIVKLEINEIDILKLKEKMPVQISVDSLPGESFPGKIEVLSLQAQEAGGRSSGKVFETEVSFSHVDPRIRIGMTARVSAVMEKRVGVLKMSLSGLFEDEGRTLVYLHREGNKPQQVEITPGFKTAMEVEVLAGLKEGDQVFTEKPVDFEPLSKADGKKTAPAASSAK